ncbi:MAG: 16S rRNA (adenine(1518)-N(6)/adenine(1519)-N(6))-dimethyltransferase RsmA [Alphaproteobacteria bacterium]|nr:16S rRNA (adenine(1518)-N(6)/adenine(1519)-N(6))-dimethyltransferase RsmA [Alphaproteobacteria bacterium]
MDAIKPSRHFSQNFLIDEKVQKKIASSLSPSLHDTLLEIGPGTGALTQHLVHQKVRRFVVAEFDKRCVDVITEKFLHHAHMHLHHVDILKFNWLTLPDDPLYIIGSLPYHITSDIILHVLRAPQLVEANFVVQKEVGERLTAKPGSKTYGRLSVLLQLLTNPSYLFDISPESFFPKPKVTSALISMRKAVPHFVTKEGIRYMERLTNLCFQQRRKQLKNILKGSFPHAQDSLNHLGITESARPETLTPELFYHLSVHIFERHRQK